MLAGVLALVLAAPSRSADDLSGLYFVADGPQAGSLIESDASGGVDDGRHGARGHVRRPNAKCGYLHFKGEIREDKTNAKSCWRVIPLPRTSALGRELQDAIAFELKAASVNAHDPKEALRFAEKSLNDAFDLAQQAAAGGGIGREVREAQG